jgi:hypothetical protein
LATLVTTIYLYYIWRDGGCPMADKPPRLACPQSYLRWCNWGPRRAPMPGPPLTARCSYCHAAEVILNCGFEVEHVALQDHGGADELVMVGRLGVWRSVSGGYEDLPGASRTFREVSGAVGEGGGDAWPRGGEEPGRVAG